MIPEKLVLKGVYSYRKETLIDFSTLCSADLFGIFGKVGSGKSAILEAVTYCLYGRIERLSSNRLYYNMMNLGSNEMYIDFIFSHKGKRYRFSFETKRSKRDFNKIESPKRAGYIEKGGEWVPLFDKDGNVGAEEILELGYDNFRRTVIVPQGRFQEFLHLEGQARRSMLMELFSLDRFDLAGKASALLNRNREKQAGTEGALSALDDVSRQRLEDSRTELEAAQSELAGLTEKISRSEKVLAELEECRRLTKALGPAGERLNEKKSESELREKRGLEIAEYEKCRDLFKSDYDRLESLKEDSADTKRKMSTVAAEAEKTEAEHAADQKIFIDIKEEFDKLPVLKKQAEWLAALAAVKKETETAKGLSAELEQKKEFRRRRAEEEQELRRQITERKDEALAAEAAGISIEEMNRLSAWYGRMDDCRSRIEACAAEMQGLENELLELSDPGPAFAILREFKLPGGTEMLTGPESIKEAEEAAVLIEGRLEDLDRSIRERRIEAEISSGIESLAAVLEDGKPCPVCGALEHPSPAAAGEIEVKEVEKLESDLARGRELMKKLRKELDQRRTTEQVVSEKLALCRRRSREENECRRILLSGFDSKEFDPDDSTGFGKAYNDFLAAEEKRRSKLEASAELTEKAEYLAGELRLMDEEITGINLKITAARARADGMLHNIEKPFAEEHGSKTEDVLLKQSRLLFQRVESTEKKYRAAEESLEQTARKKEKLSAENGLLKELADELDAKIETHSERFRLLINESQFNSEEDVREILGRDYDVESEKKMLEEFRREFDKAVTEYERLKAELSGRVYNSDAHEKERETIGILKKRLAEYTALSGELGKTVSDMEAKLKQKKQLQKELEQLKVRGENINTLKKLFIGKKFIDYAATIYLRELVDSANTRFRKLTRESLRLELDDANNFMIRDYLNDGKTRSIKTLSGGQTFQAAFSLSLALADSIGREKAGFFFLDEGFGSLDRESLSLVFESLKTLKNEARTVGIISHVEELKQEIDTFITVERTEDEGSFIKESWTI